MAAVRSDKGLPSRVRVTAHVIDATTNDHPAVGGAIVLAKVGKRNFHGRRDRLVARARLLGNAARCAA